MGWANDSWFFCPFDLVSFFEHYFCLCWAFSYFVAEDDDADSFLLSLSQPSNQAFSQGSLLSLVKIVREKPRVTMLGVLVCSLLRYSSSWVGDQAKHLIKMSLDHLVLPESTGAQKKNSLADRVKKLYK